MKELLDMPECEALKLIKGDIKKVYEKAVERGECTPLEYSVTMQVLQEVESLLDLYNKLETFIDRLINDRR